MSVSDSVSVTVLSLPKLDTRIMKELGRQRKNLKDDLRRLKYKRVSGSLQEGQGYANKRKNAAISRYLRLRRKGSKNSQLQDQLQHGVNHDDVAKDEDSPGSNRVGSQVKPFSAKGRKEANPSPGVKEDVLKDPKDWKVLPTKRSQGSHRFSNAQKVYQDKQAKRRQREQALQEEKMKREKALGEYKKRKAERNKKFSQRTRRGQPIMKHQIDFLLEKIKAQGD